mmetsp:Transcript_18950/g.43023  ORF Transcript_18950/g.43023 Transcript_18950/m.43023 type:complete len:198 (-) Transcript_18950:284-877(-)
MKFLAFLLVLAPKAFALRVHPRTAPSMGLAGAGGQGPPTPRVHVGGRRSFFAGTVAAISSAALAGVSTPASAKELALAPADLLFDELKDLKALVHDGLKANGPVGKSVGNTLEPLQRILEYNPNNTAEMRAKALELKGHMLELKQAMAAPDGYEPYVSKSTKETYPGGKVERELEEAVETVGEYCALTDCSQLFVAR